PSDGGVLRRPGADGVAAVPPRVAAAVVDRARGGRAAAPGGAVRDRRAHRAHRRRPRDRCAAAAARYDLPAAVAGHAAPGARGPSGATEEPRGPAPRARNT